MREVFVIGGGAREHAMTLKLSESANVYCAPGNPGIAEIATCVPIPIEDIFELLKFAKSIKPAFTIVGPEGPLALGIADRFLDAGLPIFAPTKQAAQLETSKIFAKNFMDRYKIPTASFKSFGPADSAELRPYLIGQELPIVIKDEGLAAGKGVHIIHNLYKAIELSSSLLNTGKKIILEEFLEGDEVSITAICEGTDFLPMLVTQDHKQLFAGGPNTGGMGVYTPVPFVSKELEKSLYQDILQPILDGLVDLGIDFTGFLYINLMLTKNGPKVLEINTRMGDPETQALLMLLKNDFYDVILDVLAGNIRNIKLQWLNKFAQSLTLASKGYPGDYETGKIITGIKEAEKISDVKVMHAGTRSNNNDLETAGGRVLSVVALGNTLRKANKKDYLAASKIYFDGVYYRSDIASSSLK